MMKKGVYCTVLAVLLIAAVFVLPIVNHGSRNIDNVPDGIGKSSHVIADDSKPESSAPEITTPKSDETVTFIVKVSGDDLTTSMLSFGKKYSSLKDFILSSDSREYIDQQKKNQAVVKAGIRRIIASSDFEGCYTYTALFNGFSVRAPYSVLPKLQKINGVESVCLVTEKSASIADTENTVISQKDESVDTQPDPHAARSTDIGLKSDKENGKGTLIAVIDDGFDILAADFSGSSPEITEKANSISQLDAKLSFCSVNALAAASGRVLYSYDYAERDNDTKNKQSSHGTLVASLMASGGTDNTAGIAQASCLALMKVCKNGSRTSSDDVLLAALDDAAKLSPDILNISMGSSGINNNAEIFTPVFEKLEMCGVMVFAAAGNDGTLSNGPGFAATLTDYGTVSYPSSLSCVTASGSFNSSCDIKEYLVFGKTMTEFSEMKESFGKSFDSYPGGNYVFISGGEASSENETISLKGKVAIAAPEENDISKIVEYVSSTTAVGLVIVGDDVPVVTGESNLFTAVVPASMLSYFEENPTGSISFNGPVAENAKLPLAPSDFSSYGASPDLTLKPDLLAAGTDIFASLNGEDTYFSGTSASSAETAAAAAVLKSTASKLAGSSRPSDVSGIIKAMLMNNADLCRSGSLYSSPRLQGSGRLNISSAMDATMTVTCGDKPSVSMGADPDGKYEFTITIHNYGDAEEKLSFSSLLTTDKLSRENGIYINELKPTSINKDTRTVFTYGEKTVDSIKLSPGKSADIKVSIELSEGALEELSDKAENGFYIDGFIFLKSSSSKEIHIPVMGFCGDLSSSEMFDSSIYDESPAALGKCSVFAAAADGGSYPGCALGVNMTTGAASKDRITIGRDTVRNYTDSQTAEVSFIIPDFYLLRNAVDYTIEIYDSKDETIYGKDIGSCSPFTDSSGEPYLELLKSFNSDDLKNTFAELKEGDYKLKVSARPAADKSGSAAPATISYDFTVDNTPPSALITKTYLRDGRIYLDMHAADVGGIQGFILYTAASGNGSYSYGDRLDKLAEQNYINEDCCTLVNAASDETTADYTYDITGLYHQLSRLTAYSGSTTAQRTVCDRIFFRAVDYAYNLSEPAAASTLSESYIEATITDQNGKAVEGAVLSNGVSEAVSDSKGKAVFRNTEPGLYALTIASLPEGCLTDYDFELAEITLTAPLFSTKIKVERSVYPEEESSEPETEKTKQSEEQEIKHGTDPAFAILFVGILLAISAVSLLISKRKRNIVPDQNEQNSTAGEENNL